MEYNFVEESRPFDNIQVTNLKIEEIVLILSAKSIFLLERSSKPIFSPFQSC